MNTSAASYEKSRDARDEPDERLVRKSSKSKSRNKEHRRHRRHTGDSGVSKEELKKHSSKKSKKKKREKKKHHSPSHSPSNSCDDGSLSEDSGEDMTLKAEVSLPSKRDLGRSKPRDSSDSSSPGSPKKKVSSAEGKSTKSRTADVEASLLSSSPEMRDRKESSRTRSSRSSRSSRTSSGRTSSSRRSSGRTSSGRANSGDIPRQRRPKNKMRRHKRELMDALTPIEGEYLTVRRKPGAISGQMHGEMKSTESSERESQTRRMSVESSSSDSPGSKSGSQRLESRAAARRPSDASVKVELRAQIEQSLLGSQSSLLSSSTRHEDSKPAVARAGSGGVATSSAAEQLEELRAKRKPLKPLAPKKKDENDENRHKRELMRELTPTDYRVVTRTRASIPKPPPIPEELPELKSPPIADHLNHEPTTLPSMQETSTDDKKEGKKKGSNPFSTIKKFGRRGSKR